MKQCFFILVFSILLTSSLDAQKFNWPGLLHGIHPISMELEKKGTWVVGHMYAAKDTFELEAKEVNY